MAQSSKSFVVLSILVMFLLLSGCNDLWDGSPGEFNLVISGTVTDAETGKPVEGARVADNVYGGAPNRPCQEAWTDKEGHYELKTWHEHHTMVASAPGYPPRLLTLIEPQMEMNISISRNARSQTLTSEPSVKIVGKINDEKTGDPVVGARVADNMYAGKPNRACQEAWTDEEGRYELMTWYEEHSLVVSAPGYPPKLVGLATKIFGHEAEVEMNISISRSIN